MLLMSIFIFYQNFKLLSGPVKEFFLALFIFHYYPYRLPLFEIGKNMRGPLTLYSNRSLGVFPATKILLLRIRKESWP